MLIEREEIIDCESYYKFCDYHYSSFDKEYPSGVVHVDITAIPDFFNSIKDNGNKYIVISSCSDYGLHLQKQHPVWKDIEKAAGIFINEGQEYDDIKIPARCNKARCSIEDKYSIKCYCHTECTFNEIPSNICHWFLVNNNIPENDRISSIPFGINGTNGCNNARNMISQHKPASGRQYLLYFNVQFNNLDRVRLLQRYSKIQDVTCKYQISFEEYLKDLSEHQFVFSPPGNGIDCYRTYESLYMGTIPILEANYATAFLYKLNIPALFCSDLLFLDANSVKKCLDNYADRSKWDLTGVKLGFWEKQIEDCRNRFGV